ncbi:MAG TPA: hydrogenase maturation nickel metallochaperone HypA [Chloroflexota bacterium]|nr:hydrogenase maturation nickel metallochaperone HypA [Chloroflexota bacterium]
MYETLAEEILDVVLQAANGEHVREVRVQAGALQRIVPESLRACFERAAAGTPAADAALTIDEIPARIGCCRCLAQVELTIPPFVCARCGTSEVEFLGGDELVESVELDSGGLHRPGAYGIEDLETGEPEPLRGHVQRLRRAYAMLDGYLRR